MVNNCVLFVIFLNFLLAAAQDGTGNVILKGYSALPQEPIHVASKSLTANCGCIRVLTFDDISNAGKIQYSPIQNGYGGLNWVNAYYMNTTWESVSYGWNGYATGRNSGIFAGFNANGQQMSMGVPVGQYFQLNSMVLAAAWNNNLVVTIKGIRANVVLYQTVVTLQVASKTTLYTLKWSGIDTVTFNATGGTPYGGLSGVGTQFIFDDVEVSI